MTRRHFHPAWVARAVLAAPVLLATVFAAVPLAPAHAESICDIAVRSWDGALPDGAWVSIRGRVTKAYDSDADYVATGSYVYEITENGCPVFVMHNRRIKCRGQVAIRAKYDFSSSDVDVVLYDAIVSCK